MRSPGKLRSLDATVFWFPHFLGAPRLLPPNSVVTIHDLIPLRASHGPREKLRRILARTILASVCRQAAVIVCGSTSVRKELLQVHPEVEPRATVAGNGVLVESWIPLDQEQRSIIRSGLRLGRYLLAVGIEEERKNHRLLLEILALLPESLGDLSVVLVGEEPKRRKKRSVARWRLHVDEWRAANPHLAGRLIELGEVNEYHLWKLYTAAEALVFPSTEEGFGLPVLEAMACGTCVVASDCEPMLSIAGSAALFADPGNPEEWVAKIRSLLEDPELARDLAQRGRAHVRERWSWTAATRELVAIFNSLCVAVQAPQTAPRGDLSS